MPETRDAEARPSKTQRAYRLIKDRIVDGIYGPGHRLVLDTVARDLDVSAVPVREAIRMLEAEGLITFRPNAGAQVAGIDPTAFEHAMQTLTVVEGAATGLAAAHIPEDAVLRAQELNDRLRGCLDEFDPDSFTRLNHEFHAAVYEHCPNPELLELVRRCWTRMATIRRSTFAFVPGRAAASVAEHDRLLALIRDGADADTVERCARAHRTATAEAFLAGRRS